MDYPETQLVRENPFKASLAERRVMLGFWSALASAVLAEIVAESNFEWILFDAEHAPNDVQSLMAQLQAIRFSGISAVVRPPANQAVYIKQVLDIGFRNVLVPNVQSVAEAEHAVAATRYPPHGIRGVSAYHRNNGYGRVQDYFSFINNAVSVIAQIESVEGMVHLENIGAVSGVDALFVGPGDLAASLGHLGQVKHPKVQEAIRSIGERAVKAGLVIGIAAGDAADITRYENWGYRLFTVASDVLLYRQAVEALSASANNREL